MRSIVLDVRPLSLSLSLVSLSSLRTVRMDGVFNVAEKFQKHIERHHEEYTKTSRVGLTTLTKTDQIDISH